MKRIRIWLITDTHFCHDELIRKKLRPINYQDKILTNWKRDIKDDDIVIHLGDVALGKSRECSDIIQSLPGRKILCMGNHDKRTVNWYMDNGFDFACTEFTMRNIIFSHRPVKPREYIKYNIHGHLHTISRYNGYIPAKNNWHRLLSLEMEKYKPILLDRFIHLSKDAEYYKKEF